ncbi:hypothetical protein VFPPC_18247 [Pochonia chlamydosporia 170]|uniref:Uncharacterized protein n=1 Tax=Pochonia chlamydosporia 170 TaxID=1380566 RepID=A0A219AR00_METCM|nr:hypothetical protein VFPPC_18247 [Pochonia chlamydosporia 170]OWT43032.1 hypothetical protein VFPPC_18247 [Pochonia chlamydosporia 170]
MFGWNKVVIKYISSYLIQLIWIDLRCCSEELVHGTLKWRHEALFRCRRALPGWLGIVWSQRMRLTVRRQISGWVKGSSCQSMVVLSLLCCHLDTMKLHVVICCLIMVVAE